MAESATSKGLVAQQPEVRLDAANAGREREDEQRRGGAAHRASSADSGHSAYEGTLLGPTSAPCECDDGMPSFAMVSPSKSNSTITTGSLPTTQPS